MLMEAHEAYRAGNIDTALLKYAMLAELGYEVAQSNVAYILDHGKLVQSCINFTVMKWSYCHPPYFVFFCVCSLFIKE